MPDPSPPKPRVFGMAPNEHGKILEFAMQGAGGAFMDNNTTNYASEIVRPVSDGASGEFHSHNKTKRGINII